MSLDIQISPQKCQSLDLIRENYLSGQNSNREKKKKKKHNHSTVTKGCLLVFQRGEFIYIYIFYIRLLMACFNGCYGGNFPPAQISYPISLLFPLGIRRQKLVNGRTILQGRWLQRSFRKQELEYLRPWTQKIKHTIRKDKKWDLTITLYLCILFKCISKYTTKFFYTSNGIDVINVS